MQLVALFWDWFGSFSVQLTCSVNATIIHHCIICYALPVAFEIHCQNNVTEYYRMEHAKCNKFIDHESSLESHSAKKCHTHGVMKGLFVVCLICFLFVCGRFWICGQLLFTRQVSFQQNPYPIKCPNGTFNPNEGRKHVSECVKCTEGYYCEPEGLEKEVNSYFFFL